MTIDELIAELEKVRAANGGGVPVSIKGFIDRDSTFAKNLCARLGIPRWKIDGTPKGLRRGPDFWGDAYQVYGSPDVCVIDAGEPV